MKSVLFFIFFGWSAVIQAAPDSLSYIAPTFPGGITALNKYANDYINYPQEKVMNNITGYVDAIIFINKEGKVKLVRTSGAIPEFNSEVKRVMKLCPNWEPAKKNGIAIDTMVNQRVWFSLEKADKRATKNDITIIIYSEPLAIGSNSDFMAILEKERAEKAQVDKLNEEGAALMKEKKFDEAIVKFNEAIKLGGARRAILFNRGLAYLNLKEDDKAREDFLEAYRLGDEDAGKIYNDLFNK